MLHCVTVNRAAVIASLVSGKRTRLQFLIKVVAKVHTWPHTTRISFGVLVTLFSPTNPALKYDQASRLLHVSRLSCVYLPGDDIKYVYSKCHRN